MKQRIILAFAAVLLVSCQLFAPRPTPGPTPSIPPLATPTASLPAETPTATAQNASRPTAAVPNPSLTTIQADTARPFFDLPLARWSPAPYSGQLDALPVALEGLANPAVIAGLTGEQRALLSANGFTVLATQEAQFSDIRFEVADQNGQPYYLTTDAAFHALHVNFNELLKSLEREQFRPQMIRLTQALFDQTQIYRQAVEDTALEADARLAAAYLAVALKLFDPGFTPPGDLQPVVDAQAAQIMAAAGRAKSTLLPDFEDDYSAYKPAGHYTTHPDLETYFRGMTWFGRVAFVLKDGEQSGIKPSRAPLIVTLALREADVDQGRPAAQAWAQLHEVFTFLVGPSDDPGPIELASLMDSVYGPSLSIERLADEELWQAFLQRAGELPAPQINSTFAASTKALSESRDWRLMGQRFTLDGFILQNMVFDQVGTQQNPRKLPSGLDVMAVFGSPAALTALEQAGETAYENYLPQLQKLQTAVQAQPEREWLNVFASGWLYAFIPQVSIKNDAYPPYMRTTAWSSKALNSALGSWAELKHDTVLYTKMPEFMGGGGPPSSGPAPAYVEPNPDVFYRLAYLAQNLAEGLSVRGLASSPSSESNGRDQPVPLDRLAGAMSLLGQQFNELGNIAARELEGKSPSETERELITGCLGLIECDDTILPEQPPVPVIAAVAGADDEVLQAAVGGVDRIYVVVVIEDRLFVAQGGVFSYYEFRQPRVQRLTDEEWRDWLGGAPPARPAFTAAYLRRGGAPQVALAFRVGDVYIITGEGGNPPLNVRAEPSTTAGINGRLTAGTYIQITGGPVTAGQNTWWQIEEMFTGVSGWVVENAAWYERAHGQ